MGDYIELVNSPIQDTYIGFIEEPEKQIQVPKPQEIPTQYTPKLKDESKEKDDLKAWIDKLTNLNKANSKSSFFKIRLEIDKETLEEAPELESIWSFEKDVLEQICSQIISQNPKDNKNVAISDIQAYTVIKCYESNIILEKENQNFIFSSNLDEINSTLKQYARFPGRYILLSTKQIGKGSYITIANEEKPLFGIAPAVDIREVLIVKPEDPKPNCENKKDRYFLYNSLFQKFDVKINQKDYCEQLSAKEKGESSPNQISEKERIDFISNFSQKWFNSASEFHLNFSKSTTKIPSELVGDQWRVYFNHYGKNINDIAKIESESFFWGVNYSPYLLNNVSKEWISLFFIYGQDEEKFLVLETQKDYHSTYLLKKKNEFNSKIIVFEGTIQKIPKVLKITIAEQESSEKDYDQSYENEFIEESISLEKSKSDLIAARNNMLRDKSASKVEWPTFEEMYTSIFDICFDPAIPKINSADDTRLLPIYKAIKKADKMWACEWILKNRASDIQLFIDMYEKLKSNYKFFSDYIISRDLKFEFELSLISFWNNTLYPSYSLEDFKPKNNLWVIKYKKYLNELVAPEILDLQAFQNSEIIIPHLFIILRSWKILKNPDFNSSQFPLEFGFKDFSNWVHWFPDQ